MKTIALALCVSAVALQSSRAQSHPPLRVPPMPMQRPLDKSPTFFVDAKNGSDTNDGSLKSPWKTIRHAAQLLKAGHTLCLRGGTFYEASYLALVGTKENPITIRAYPGEQVILDAGWAEYVQNPAAAWEPYPKGGPGEYRSTRTHPNARNVVGWFGDSMVGLQTYYHAQDLRAENELADMGDVDLKPLYCGPGLWYDASTGHIHMRLAHTHLPAPVVNYQGATDPRKLPMVLAPFNATVLHLDEAKHLRFQDLIVRGAGYVSIRLDQAQGITFDNVTVWCGTYGLRANGATDLRLEKCGFYGSLAPWTFRSDASKRDYPGRPSRNISRFNTHALIEIDNGRESSVYATPQNDRWEISHCEFTDAHDGVYLGAINVDFHHNLISNLQDDGIYLSPMYFRHKLDKTDPTVKVHHNIFRGMLTALAFGGTETVTRDRVFIYRNIFDLRPDVMTSRPTTKKPEAGISHGHMLGDHGSPPWSAMAIYHNTVVQPAAREAAVATMSSTKSGNERRVFNNIFYHMGKLPAFAGPDPKNNSVADANLFWSPGADPKVVKTFFQKFRASPLYEESKKLYPAGSTTNGVVADPQFLTEVTAGSFEFRLKPTSPAKDAGVELPDGYPDSDRKDDVGRPDIGAFRVGSEMFAVGRR